MAKKLEIITGRILQIIFVLLTAIWFTNGIALGLMWSLVHMLFIIAIETSIQDL